MNVGWCFWPILYIYRVFRQNIARTNEIQMLLFIEPYNNFFLQTDGFTLVLIEKGQFLVKIKLIFKNKLIFYKHMDFSFKAFAYEKPQKTSYA